MSPPNFEEPGECVRVDSENYESVCETVVSGVAAVSGEPPAALEPLFDSVDPDALEQLVASMDVNVSIWFEYCDHRVVVGGDGYVTVCDCLSAE